MYVNTSHLDMDGHFQIQERRVQTEEKAVQHGKTEQLPTVNREIAVERAVIPGSKSGNS